MKKLLALVICFIFVGVGSISAQSETGILYKKHTFELGPEASYRTYKEPGEMKERGMMYGLGVSYAYHNKIMLKAEGKGSVGWTHFSDSGQIDNMRDIRGLGGYDFPILKSSILTPYTGIGLRYLNNDVLPKPYERESYYVYTPIGIAFITDLGKGWSLGETAEYDYFWWGYQTSHPMDQLPGLTSDIVSNQRDGYGLRGSITLEKKYKKVIFEGGPFVNYWSIEKLSPHTLPYLGSPTGFVWQEPGNHSVQVGIKLAVKF